MLHSGCASFFGTWYILASLRASTGCSTAVGDSTHLPGTRYYMIRTYDTCVVARRLLTTLLLSYERVCSLYVPYREAIKNIRHGNEVLKSDLAWEARESRFITNPSAASEIQRLQDQADIYAKKTEQVRVFALRRLSCTLLCMPCVGGSRLREGCTFCT